MAILLGVDIGTTTITSLALDLDRAEVVALHTISTKRNRLSVAADEQHRFEWDPRGLAAASCECMRAVAEQLGERCKELAAVGITGQQHSTLIVDRGLEPLTPLIGWQDGRGADICPTSKQTYVEQARRLAGADAPQRSGCRLSAGYMGVTLFWLQSGGMLPASGAACFITDFLGSLLTGKPPVCDPTNAASSGLLDVRQRCWDSEAIEALGLPLSLFPEIRECTEMLGTLVPSAAEMTGLPQGLPVLVALGDNQAGFIGSVSDRSGSALVNVGTGGQVAAFTDTFAFVDSLECRPFPVEGYLLVGAVLCGGKSYEMLGDFFRSVAEQVFALDVEGPNYEVMNRLAASVPRGAEGLVCEPFFTGTRAEPERRASWSGVSPENLTAAHFVRALLEAVAKAMRNQFEAIQSASGKSYDGLVGAGNGLRENAVLAEIVAHEFSMPLALGRWREEAALGAALVAAVGTGCCEDLASAARQVAAWP